MAIQSNFPSVRPSLLLDFASTKQLDSRITYTRASTATFYNGVTTAMAEQNLWTYSQDFDNGAWVKQGATVTANTIAAPDGTTTADSFIPLSGTNGASGTYRNITTVAVPIVLSIYAKAGSKNFIAVYGGTVSGSTAYFNVSTGVLGTVGANCSNTTITSVGSGWYRLSTTIASSAGAYGYYCSDADNSLNCTGDGTTTGAYFWGAQQEQRSTVTAYTATTTQAITNYIPVLQTAASGVARFDNNPTTGESLGLLIEESRTNLTTYSSQFDDATWNKINVAITANNNVSPDGTLNADGMYETAVTSEHNINNTNPTFSASTAYTLSAYVKPIGGRNCSLFWYTNSINTVLTATFDITAGTIVTAATASGSAPPTSVSAAITAVGNGWYRVSISGTTTGTAGVGAIRIHAASGTSNNYAGDTSKGIFVWGAQLEAGSFATSYIPTVASQVTRAADAASMTGTNFSSWYNAAEGTLFSSGLATASVSQRFAGINDNSDNNAIRVFYRAANSGGFTVNVSGTAQADLSPGGSLSGVNVYLAGAYKVNDFACSVNGLTAVTDTSGTVPVVTQFQIGTAAGVQLNGTIKKLAYYPLRVTNAQLQALTS